MTRARRSVSPGAFDAVCFDFFDTLCVIDEGRYFEGQRAVAGMLGLPFDSFFRFWVEAGKAGQIGDFQTERDRFLHVLARLDREISGPLLTRAVALQQEVLLDATALHLDAEETLRALQRAPGYRIGLISNATSSAFLLFLNLRLPQFFHEILFSFQVGAMKPARQIYLLACQRLRVDPSRTLFIGDGGAQELDGARLAGMTAVKIHRQGALELFRRGESRGWDRELNDLREILPDLGV